MLRMVIDDYRSQAKQALKEVCGSGTLLAFLFMMIYPPYVSDYQVDGWLLYFDTFVPMFFGMLLSRMYPNRLSKTLLLCPMTEDEKQVYLVTGFRLRVLLPFLMYLMCSGIFGLMGKLKLLHFGYFAVYLFMFLISVNIYSQPRTKSENLSVKFFDLPGNYNLWEMVDLLGGFLLCYVVVANFVEKHYSNGWIIVVVLGLVAEFLIAFNMVKNYYKPVMENGRYYESILQTDRNK